MEKLIRVGLEDLARCFGIEGDLYEKYVVGEITENQALRAIISQRENIGDWQQETPLGGPGTVLNGCALYSLVRHCDMCDILETGVSGGFYTAFLLAALDANKLHSAGVLNSLELSSDEQEVGKLIPESLKSANVDWYLRTGHSSLKYFEDLKPNTKHCAELYCHDSLHTVSHMLKELIQFKESVSSRFFIYIDDQNSENFWQIALQTNAFYKVGYDVKYISGNESRLNGHLGGFIKYEKNNK